MKVYIDIGAITIPTYGLMISLGVVLANIVAVIILHKIKLDLNDFIILESYCFLGAFVGSKVLYILISIKYIDWKQIANPVYFNGIMQGGFVFYGGLIGGLIFVILAGKIHKIEADIYIRNFVFLIPFIHAFGRVGCFFAGCCFGLPYDGFGSVIFPINSYALPNVKLFPVQLVEALILLLITLFIIFLRFKMNWKYTIETYLLLYAKARFAIEYLRYDYVRGVLGVFSTSQWISIAIIIITTLVLWYEKTTINVNKK